MCLRHGTTPVKLQKRKKISVIFLHQTWLLMPIEQCTVNREDWGYFLEIQITHICIYIKGPITA